MKDTKFMTAKVKELTLKQWRTFIRDGMQAKHFTKRIYDHLILHCSFIAHYNREGFYYTYFQQPEDTIKFLRQFDPDGNHLSVEYGMIYWWTGSDYHDLNDAMCQVVGEYIEQYTSQKLKEVRTRDVLLAKSLLAKHGIAINRSLRTQ